MKEGFIKAQGTFEELREDKYMREIQEIHKQHQEEQKEGDAHEQEEEITEKKSQFTDEEIEKYLK